MCSELFRIPVEIGVVPIFGFGVLLALWIAVSAVTTFIAFQNHGNSAEAWGNLPLVILVAAAIVFLPKLFPTGLPIRGYGVMLLVAVSSSVALAVARGRQLGIDSDVFLSMVFGLFVCGIIGARLFYVIEYWESDFESRDVATTIAKVVNFTQGGLVIYGGLIGGCLAFFWYSRKHGLPTLAMADFLAPSVMLGLAIGRIGCLLNGCCYGGVCDAAWAVTFPKESPPYSDQVARGEQHGFRIASDENKLPIVVASSGNFSTLDVDDVIVEINGHGVTSFDEARQSVGDAYYSRNDLNIRLDNGNIVTIPAVPIAARSKPVHPTQIYSTINAGLITWFLWSFYPFRRRDGEVAALMLTIYPISRFLLEMIRVDESAIFDTGLSISQNVSVAVLCLTVAGWFYLRSLPPKLASFTRS